MDHKIKEPRKIVFRTSLRFTGKARFPLHYIKAGVLLIRMKDGRPVSSLHARVIEDTGTINLRETIFNKTSYSLAILNKSHLIESNTRAVPLIFQCDAHKGRVFLMGNRKGDEI